MQLVQHVPPRVWIQRVLLHVVPSLLFPVYLQSSLSVELWKKIINWHFSQQFINGVPYWKEDAGLGFTLSSLFLRSNAEYHCYHLIYVGMETHLSQLSLKLHNSHWSSYSLIPCISFSLGALSYTRWFITKCHCNIFQYCPFINTLYSQWYDIKFPLGDKEAHFSSSSLYPEDTPLLRHAYIEINRMIIISLMAVLLLSLCSF